MKTLYPELEPYASGYLNTDTPHSIYFEQAGSQSGIPVLFLHGGPGTGCNENHRRYFDPDKYQIIIFDQRGCNRSKSNGDFQFNNTQHILNDIEAIRVKLNIEQFLLFGGSWGATLALLYAEQYPENVSGIILRGAFLARKIDFNWFVDEGVNRLLPDYWDEFQSQFDFTNSTELIAEIHSQVFSEDKSKQLKAAQAWSLWAGRVVTQGFVDDYQLQIEDEVKFINEVQIEMHYAKHRYFIEENQILNDISRVPTIPTKIIHGRRDLTCMSEASWLLHQSLTGSELLMVNNAGHLAGEPAMINALVFATDEMAISLG